MNRDVVGISYSLASVFPGPWRWGNQETFLPFPKQINYKVVVKAVNLLNFWDPMLTAPYFFLSSRQFCTNFGRDSVLKEFKGGPSFKNNV